MNLLLDIETLGQRPGCAIIELAAAIFDPRTGEIISHFTADILPHPELSKCDETIAWHAKHGTWPRTSGTYDPKPLDIVLAHFCEWVRENAHSVELGEYWSWGSDFDFPILQHAFDLFEIPTPWAYWEKRCARTIYKVAFGEAAKPAPRTHQALEDVTAAIGDLHTALQALKGIAPAPKGEALTGPGSVRCICCGQPFAADESPEKDSNDPIAALLFDARFAIDKATGKEGQ